jgi:hypothetical protein
MTCKLLLGYVENVVSSYSSQIICMNYDHAKLCVKLEVVCHVALVFHGILELQIYMGFDYTMQAGH